MIAPVMKEPRIGWISFSPILEDQEAFLAFCRRLATGLRKRIDRAELVGEERRALRLPMSPRRLEDIKASLVRHIALDLVGQGWQLRVRRKRVQISYPELAAELPQESKERVRRAHLIERDAQLSEPAVQEFVSRMERRRLTGAGWHSIFSLMRDGADLQAKLSSDTGIGEAIRPYLQFVEPGALCEHTGLALGDVWRYFRLTWTNVHKSVPGRSIMILVRDAAAPHHPAIGIAALGSAVVQQEIRDQWIGWGSTTFVRQLLEHPSVRTARRLAAQLDSLVRDIYVRDLLKDRVISPQDLRHPTTRAIRRLRAAGVRARHQHQKYPGAAALKAQQMRGYWRAAAQTALFRSKRCEQLSRLLAIRHSFQKYGFPARSRSAARRALEVGAVRAAIGQLIRHIKATRVGINMMDITVCGAVAPYNVLLGGKLVCMLLGSPEVVQEYARRYGTKPSVIASAMKARQVHRAPHLVLLCTTSLYGVGSSQYNRVRLPAVAVGGKPREQLEYTRLGRSRGYGSFHFSAATVQDIKLLLSRRIDGRRVNSIFGEGVNPLLRKIREGLDWVGLESDPILRHGMARVVYGVALASNFREFLVGAATRPRYLIPQTDARSRTAMIARYWQERWLRSRLQTPGVLDEVGRHTLCYPITHGARVPAPRHSEVGSQPSLWQQSS